jgi:hypothetical protein
VIKSSRLEMRRATQPPLTSFDIIMREMVRNNEESPAPISGEREADQVASHPSTLRQANLGHTSDLADDSVGENPESQQEGEPMRRSSDLQSRSSNSTGSPNSSEEDDVFSPERLASVQRMGQILLDRQDATLRRLAGV